MKLGKVDAVILTNTTTKRPSTLISGMYFKYIYIYIIEMNLIIILIINF